MMKNIRILFFGLFIMIFCSAMSPSISSSPPTGTILINGGDEVTHSTLVTLTISATDTGGAEKMMIANNSTFTGAIWEDFRESKSWTLSEYEGEKTVYIKFKDRTGSISNIYTDTIYLMRERKLFRLGGSTRYETAIEVSRAGWVSSEKVILATGENYPDSLCGIPLAAKYSCPLLLAPKEGLRDSVAQEIVRLEVKEAILLGERDALSEKVEDDLIKICGLDEKNIKRIGGIDRYETSLMIAIWVGSANYQAALATGENYPDALSASNLAAIKGMPVILVSPYQTLLSGEGNNVLSYLSVKSLLLVGESDVVSLSLENWLKENKYSTSRISGHDRYETAVALANYSLEEHLKPDYLFIARGEDFPDALAVGALAAKRKGILLLSRRTDIPNSVIQFIQSNRENIYYSFLTGQEDVLSVDLSLYWP